MAERYCAARHKDGWLCILLAGHADEEHLSLDNTALWHGTPGRPVRWRRERELPRESTEEAVKRALDPTLTHSEAELALPSKPSSAAKPPKMAALPASITNTASGMGFTGSVCGHCGSDQVIRNGSCEVCRSCGETTGCS